MFGAVGMGLEVAQSGHTVSLPTAGTRGRRIDGSPHPLDPGESARSAGKDADPDILILKQAKAEYAKLQ